MHRPPEFNEVNHALRSQSLYKSFRLTLPEKSRRIGDKHIIYKQMRVTIAPLKSVHIQQGETTVSL